MTSCYLPRPTFSQRAFTSIRHAFRTARMQWRQFKAMFSPMGWWVIAGAHAIVIGAALGFWL